MRVRNELLGAALLAAVLMVPGAAAADSLNELPRDAAEAAVYYESNPDLWLTGPVQYIVLDEERELFESLTTTADRAAFIQWFWDRRDPELRDDRNPLRDEFYVRVAESNRRYRDFPRGWKSDRGQVHVTLGRPDTIRPVMGYSTDATVWTYFTVGPNATDASFGSLAGEVAIAFYKSDQRGGYQIYGGFGGPGVIPLYVRDAMNYSKLAAIVDPFLQGDFGN